MPEPYPILKHGQTIAYLNTYLEVPSREIGSIAYLNTGRDLQPPCPPDRRNLLLLKGLAVETYRTDEART